MVSATLGTPEQIGRVGPAARISDFPTGRSADVWHTGVLRSRQADDWIQTEPASDVYRVSEGFSGTPAWDEELSVVVRMMVAAESEEPGAATSSPPTHGCATGNHCEPCPYWPSTATRHTGPQRSHCPDRRSAARGQCHPWQRGSSGAEVPRLFLSSAVNSR